jgi:rhodanese-related sulfurtransferase
MKTIAASEAKNWNGRIIDVRNLDEYAAERLPQAECVPLSQLLRTASDWNRDENLLVMCKSGMRSKQGTQQLIDAGFTNVAMLEGGIEACKKAGVDIQVNRGQMPIVRQVMIGASSLLLLGLILGTWVNGWFLLITWGVALGLLNAGLTGLCPMASMLQKMPWNKTSSAAPQSCSTGQACNV